MNGTRAKSSLKLALICGLLVALQHVKAFPHKIEINTEEEETAARVVEYKPSDAEKSLTESTTATDVEITNTTEVESEQSSEIDSSEEFFYLPEVYNTPTYRLEIRYFRLTQDYVNQLITEGRDFLENIWITMKALPYKTANIEANIIRIKYILKHIKELDLSKYDFATITEKTEITDELAELYGDFETVLGNNMPEDDADVLKEILEVWDLEGYNDRLNAYLKDTVNQITKVANKFFNKLTEEEKQKYAELIKWYEDFKKPKAEQDKYNDAVILLKYLLEH